MLFPLYKYIISYAPDPFTEQTTTYTNQSLIDTKVEYNRSFICKSEQDVGGFEPFTSDHSINVTLQVDFLQVQAFSFRNATSGAFDNGKSVDSHHQLFLFPEAMLFLSLFYFFHSMYVCICMYV